MLSDDLIAIYLTLEQTLQRPVGIEYNGRDRTFLWQFSDGSTTGVNVLDDDPADVMRVIDQLNMYLASRDLPAMNLTAVGWPQDNAFGDPE